MEYRIPQWLEEAKEDWIVIIIKIIEAKNKRILDFRAVVVTDVADATQALNFEEIAVYTESEQVKPIR